MSVSYDAEQAGAPLLLPREKLPIREERAVPERVHRLLIADDDPAICRLFEVLARREHLPCDRVGNGIEAVAALREQDYSLIFLDIMMPRVDGWGVLDYLRTHAKESMPLVFVITAYLDQVVSPADRGLVSGLLYKPVDADDVAALMRECVRGGNLIGIMQRTRHRLIGAPA